MTDRLTSRRRTGAGWPRRGTPTSTSVDEHSAAATRRCSSGLAVQPGDRVLELAAGPGTLGATWSQLVGPTGAVVAQRHRPRDGRGRPAAQRAASTTSRSTMLDAAAIDRPDASARRRRLPHGADVHARSGGGVGRDPPGPRARRSARRARRGPGIEHNPWMTCVGMAAMVNGLVAAGRRSDRAASSRSAIRTHLAALATGAGFADVEVEEIAVVFRSARSTSTSTGSARWPVRSPAARRGVRRPAGRRSPHRRRPRRRATPPTTASRSPAGPCSCPPSAPPDGAGQAAAAISSS